MPSPSDLTDAVGSGPEVRAQVEVPIDLADGVEAPAMLFTFRGLANSAEHLAVGLGSFRHPVGGVPLVRIHSECMTGDVLGSRRCDCGPQLDEAMRRIHARGGFLLYLRQEGRGIGLYSKLDAYLLRDHGLDTFEANLALGYAEDGRDYRVAAEMLLALGAAGIDLLTGNPTKTRQLTELGIEVDRVLSTALHSTPSNLHYLRTKAARGHQFAVADDSDSTCPGD
nr:GTP cyclohydrolase II RibA [Nocardioides sp. B-3]